MGKKRVLLKQQPQMALARRDLFAFLGIEKAVIV